MRTARGKPEHRRSARERAMQDDLRQAEALIAVLSRALLDAHEALYWHKGLEFQPTGSGGKSIDLIIKEALRAHVAYRRERSREEEREALSLIESADSVSDLTNAVTRATKESDAVARATDVLKGIQS